MSRSIKTRLVHKDGSEEAGSRVAVLPGGNRPITPRPFRPNKPLLVLASGLLAAWLAFLAFLALLSHK